MVTVSETIPPILQQEVDAAVAWFNGDQEDLFEVTGILDPEDSLHSGVPRELRLVLCSGETCQQQSFRVTPTDVGFDVALSQAVNDAEPGNGDSPENPDQATQAELDPPPGARRSWLTAAIRRHNFVVLVFYRGFW